MNAPTLLISAAALALAVSLGVGLALRGPDTTTTTTPAAAPSELDALVASVERLSTEQRALAQRVDQLAASSPGGARLPVGEIERLVRATLAEAGAVPASAPASEPEAVAEGDIASLEVDELVARLLDADGWNLDASEIWQQVSEAGRMDEVLAAFEARAEQHPDDPDVQVELGQAYLAKIQEVGNSPLAGKYAQQADDAFDRALGSDPQHWGARFDKAVALSFWPPVFGKQNEAVRQFEILIEQQAGLAPAPEHAQSHLLLGNLYQQLGHADKALAAWKLGLSMFPSHEGLLGQLQLTEDGH